MADERDPRVDLDDRDVRLLEYVENDFDVSLERIADELGLSKSTVHYRLKKLRDDGVIEGITADVDPLTLGLNMLMITEVTVTHRSGYASDIGERLTGVAGVVHVYYTMGDVDFVVISRAQDREGMNRILDRIVAISGVDETSSRFVMDEIKTGDTVLETLPDDVRESLTTG